MYITGEGVWGGVPTVVYNGGRGLGTPIPWAGGPQPMYPWAQPLYIHCIYKGWAHEPRSMGLGPWAHGPRPLYTVYTRAGRAGGPGPMGLGPPGPLYTVYTRAGSPGRGPGTPKRVIFGQKGSKNGSGFDQDRLRTGSEPVQKPWKTPIKLAQDLPGPVKRGQKGVPKGSKKALF